MSFYILQVLSVRSCVRSASQARAGGCAFVCDLCML